jgi:GrpB-like predicted nucleotidyltransferase (UPF0157 family)
MADPIALVPYDPRWPIYYEEEAEWLRNVLPYGLPLAVEHFGATATPEMEARPIIDILVAVQDIDEARRSLSLLSGLGYVVREDDLHTDRILLSKDDNGRAFDVVIARIDSRWYEQLLFRDHLRTSLADAARYTALRKSQSANAQAYAQAKADFVAETMAEARARAERIARQWDDDD